MTAFLASLVGPTCSAKTRVACLLAELLEVEIVGADSRQVYRGFDAGTAKPSSAERTAAPHHLVDVADPTEKFSAARYAVLARRAVEDVRRRGAVPLVVGGSGLYVRALEQGLFEGPAASPPVRRRLLDRAEREGAHVLHAELERIDPEHAQRVHPRDLVRVVRALEVQEITGLPLSAHHARHRARARSERRLAFGLAWDPSELARRIDARVRAMLDGGWVEEVENLVSRGVPDDAPAWDALGYTTVRELVLGRRTRADAEESIAQATRRFAKRQRTWFRADREIVWLKVAGEADLGPAALAVADRLRRASTTDASTGGGT